MAHKQQFGIPVLVTLDDSSEEVRTFSVEAWGMNEAIQIAKEQAREDERVVEAEAQVR